MFLHRIKNHNNFNLLTQLNHMFNNFMIQFYGIVFNLKKYMN